jgi:hypothetical protein
MKTIKIKNYSEIPKGFTGIVEFTNGQKEWYLNGKRHREDGPAIIRPRGTKSWYLNGKRHRIDGPAIEYPDGSKVWWINDDYVYGSDPIGEYILIEDGLPLEVEWLNKTITQRKVLTSDGIVYLPNLPGL